MVDYQVKNKKVSLLLCIFFGLWGAHHFYNNKTGKGILYLFTFGLFFVGWIVDIIIIVEQKENKSISNIDVNNKPTSSTNTIINNSKKSDAVINDNIEDEIEMLKRPNIQNNNIEVSFKVVGTSFDNEDGVNRQKRIKQVVQHYRKDMVLTENLYGGYSNKEIMEYYIPVVSEFEDVAFAGEYKEYDYKGERAFAIYIKDTDNKIYQIGNIARKDLNDFIDIVENNEILNTKLYLTGGKIKEIEYDSDKDKDKEVVVTKNLDYGAKIVITYK